jgi:hypothetical protein
MANRLQEKLQEDLKTALRKGDKHRLFAIRAVLSAANYAEIDKGKPLEEPDVLGVIAKEAKQRRESIEAFRKGNRQDLVDKEEGELSVLMEYLPKQMDREEIVALAKQVISEVGAKGPGDKGKVMGKLMSQVKGKAEGQLVNTIVTELLQE